MFYQKIRNRLAAIVLAAGMPLVSLTGSPLDETVNTLQQWVETERQISTARANWAQERVSIEDLIAIYRQESEQLDQVIREAADDVSVAETRRAELLARDESIKALEAQALAKIAETEIRLRALEPLLPEPVRQELRPLFRVLPENPRESRAPIGQRIQPIVGILTQIQRFNQVVTITEGFREFEAGKTVQTEKIFFGLGTAFYVDGANEHAGRGRLTASGWEWIDDNSLVGPVREFVEMYRGTRQAAYVTLPVQFR